MSEYSSSNSAPEPEHHVEALIGALGVPVCIIIGGVTVVILLLSLMSSQQRSTAPVMSTPQLGGHVSPQ
jgi:hypothetical protein